MQCSRKWKCIADHPWQTDGIKYASIKTLVFQNGIAFFFCSKNWNSVQFSPQKTISCPFSLNHKVYFKVSYAAYVLTVIFWFIFLQAISSLTNIHTSLQKLIPTEMMRAKALWSILPMVKPPTAAKGGSALPLLQGAGLLLSPHHAGRRGVIGLWLTEKVPCSPSRGGLRHKCEGPLRLSSIMKAEEQAGRMCSSLPINNPAKLQALEGQWDTGLPVYIWRPEYNL